MITKDMLEAQLRLYRDGQAKAMQRHSQASDSLEKAKAEIAAFSGAIDCCENLLAIVGQIEEVKAHGPPADLPEDLEKE